MKHSNHSRSRRYKGSASSKSSILRKNASEPLKNMPKRSLHVLNVREPKVFIGPSVEGKHIKLVEVVSGSVKDKKPFYV